MSSSGISAARIPCSVHARPGAQGCLTMEDKDETSSFAQQIKKVAASTYGRLLNVRGDYEFMLVHGKQHSHWLFLLKLEKSAFLYITMEIYTNTELQDIIPTVRRIKDTSELMLPDSACITNLEMYAGTLQYLCFIADGVVKEMIQKTENHFCSNSQQFCNNVLHTLKRETFSTTAII